MHRTMPRERETGVGMGMALQGVMCRVEHDHSEENPGKLGPAGQDSTQNHLGVGEGAGAGALEKLKAYWGSSSLATRLALLHSSPSMKASIASRMRSRLR